MNADLEPPRPTLFGVFTRTQVLILICCGVPAILFINLVFNRFYERHVFSPIFSSSVNSVIAYVDEWQRTVQSFDVAYKPFMKEILQGLARVMEENPGIPDEVISAFLSERIGSQEFQYVQKVNWYLISPQGVIERTDYPADLGLDLAKAVPRYWQGKLALLKKGDILLENLSFEVRTNVPRIFAYTRLANDWILEIGVALNPVVVESLWNNLGKIVDSNKHLKRVRLYSISFLPFGHGEKLSPEEIEKFKTEQSETGYVVEKITHSSFRVYKNWIPLTKEGGIDWTNYSLHFTVRAVMDLDFSELLSFKNQMNLILTLTMILFALMSVLVNTRQLKKATVPLSRLVERISIFELDPLDEGALVPRADAGTKEVYELEKSFQKMQKAIVEYIGSQKMDVERLKESLEDYKSKAFVDSLTGLYNRRFWTHYAANFEATGGKCTVCFADIDNLKEINDTCGHDAGDMALRFVADSIKNFIRKGDVAVRVGGDEFVVLFRDTEAGEAEKIMQRIVTTLSLVKPEVPDCTISVSYGLSEGVVDAQVTLEDLVKKADVEMYDRKSRKRRGSQNLHS